MSALPPTPPVPQPLHRCVVGARTIATRREVTGGEGINCLVGTHPGYPRWCFGVGCVETAIFVQRPEVPRTKTFVPSSACVCTAPVADSQRFWASVMSSTHCRGCAGFASAGASTCRFGPGSVQTVDTDTATYRTEVVPDDPAAGGPTTTDVNAVSSADSDTPVSR